MTLNEANMIIDYLKEIQENYIEGNGYAKLPLPEWYALDKAIQVIEQNKWIPVSERLPNRDEYIKNNGLFNVSDGNRSYSEWFDYTKQMFGGPTMDGFRVDYAVTHWMPLPEPYKAESEMREVENDSRRTYYRIKQI